MTMKLYMHPVSNTSRPVRLYIAENNLPVEEQVVDLFTGEHYKEPYISMNPNHMVPMLEDGDLRLTESSAILKYLASKFDLPDYPRELRERAKVDEAMDWFNTQFYRDYGYGLTYPQIYPHHKRPGEGVQEGTVDWGHKNAHEWFTILDQHWLAGGRHYLCNGRLSIADYFGACLATLGEVIRCDFSKYPNVCGWLDGMRKMKSWDRINEAHHGFINAVKDQPFKAL
jgi:glutathione S-transferase